MMPVPSHLANCVIPKESRIDESGLDAVVQCDCGSKIFNLLYPGQVVTVHGKPVPCVAKIGAHYFYLIRAICVSCKKDHLLFDDDFHGWNGFVCHDQEKAAIPRPQLVPWKCTTCGNTPHEASIQIASEGKDDFVENSEGEFPEDRWPDAFGWFSMSIKCCTCGQETTSWASHETM